MKKSYNQNDRSSAGLEDFKKSAAFKLKPEVFLSSKFRQRVEVFSLNGRRLFHCPAGKAASLCFLGAAEVHREDLSLHRFWRITLLRASGRPIGEPRPLTASSYRGQSYTYWEHVLNQYYVVRLRHLSPEDRWAFILSQTDCMPSWNPSHFSV